MPLDSLIDVFLPAFTSVLAALTALFNCETFTASVSSVPALTPVIFLSPALIPSFVTDTSPAVKPSLSKATSSPTLIPSLFITVSPVVTLLMLISLANLIFNVSSPSAITPILLSESSSALFASPLILIVEPNLRSNSEPKSPAKVNGILRTLLIALVTSPAVARLLGFAAVALPSPSVSIVVVLTLNVTSEPLPFLVTLAVVNVPFTKFTKPLLLIRDLEVPFCCTLKPLLCNTV